MKWYCGIDGCPAGWFFVHITKAGDYRFSLVPKAGEYSPAGRANTDHAATDPAVADRANTDRAATDLAVPDRNALFCNELQSCTLALIDIPIGLRSGNEHTFVPERKCDILMRKLLGKRGSAVFPVPVREAVYADDYGTACNVNKRYTGKKLSKQTWNIVPKIKEIDRFLRAQREYIPLLRESSPEVCFLGLNGALPTYPKKRREGTEERLAILSRFFPNTDKLYRHALDTFARKRVQHHDVVDALVLSVAALSCGSGHMEKIPSVPEPDGEGIPMQAILYRVFSCRF